MLRLAIYSRDGIVLNFRRNLPERTYEKNLNY